MDEDHPEPVEDVVVDVLRDDFLDPIRRNHSALRRRYVTRSDALRLEILLP